MSLLVFSLKYPKGPNRYNLYGVTARTPERLPLVHRGDPQHTPKGKLEDGLESLEFALMADQSAHNSQH